MGEPVEAPEGASQEVVQLVQLRNEQREACEAQLVQLEALNQQLTFVKENQLAPLAAAVGGIAPTVDEVRNRLQLEDGLPVELRKDATPAKAGEVQGGSVQVANPPDLEGVEEATLTGAETMNQTSWGLAGLLVGFGFLFVLYRVFKP